MAYSAYSEEARAALLKRVEDEKVLRDIPHAFQKERHFVRVSISCAGEERSSQAFKDRRARLEAALGPEVMRVLRVSTDLYPIP